MSEHAVRLWDISFGCKRASSQREAARAALRLAVKRTIRGGQPRSELPPRTRQRAQVRVALKRRHLATVVQGGQPRAFSAVHGVSDRPPHP